MTDEMPAGPGDRPQARDGGYVLPLDVVAEADDRLQPPGDEPGRDAARWEPQLADLEAG